MMVLLIAISAVIVVLAFESLFCSLMKKRAHNLRSIDSRKTEDGNVERLHVTSAPNAKVIILKILGDFTFLLFKVTGYIPSHAVRNFVYRHVFKVSIAKNAVIYYNSFLL